MVTIKIDSRAHLGLLSEFPAQVGRQIKDRLTFPNPAFQEAEKRGFSTWNIPQEIQGFQVEGDRLIIPRGVTRQLVGIMQGAGLRYQIEDQRRTLAEVDFNFLGNLKDFQQEADLEGPEWEGFLNTWAEVIGESAKTCQEVTAILRDNSDFASTLPDNLENVLKDPEKSFERSLGRALAKKEKRPYGENNLALQRVGTHQKAILWKVAPLSILVSLGSLGSLIP